MFIPLRDHPNPSGFRPWVTWLLLATNVVIFVLVALPGMQEIPSSNDPRLYEYAEGIAPLVSSRGELRAWLGGLRVYDLVVFEYGFRPASPQALALFTSMFLHAGFMHLFGNMLFLWIYGDNVEHRLGHGRFLLAYLGTGVVATLGHTLLSGGSPLPLIGASGAISGVLGFYFLWFPRNKIEVFLFFFPFWLGRVYVPARLLLGFYVVADNLLPVLIGAGGSVAHGAHLGGFFGGLLWAFIWRSRAPKGGPGPVPKGAIRTPLKGRSSWKRRHPFQKKRPRF